MEGDLHCGQNRETRSLCIQYSAGGENRERLPPLKTDFLHLPQPSSFAEAQIGGQRDGKTSGEETLGTLWRVRHRPGIKPNRGNMDYRSKLETIQERGIDDPSLRKSSPLHLTPLRNHIPLYKNPLLISR